MARYHQVLKNIEEYIYDVLKNVTINVYPSKPFKIRSDKEKALTSLAETVDVARLVDFEKAFKKVVNPHFYKGSGFTGKECTFQLRIKYPRIADWGIAAQDDFAVIESYILDNQPTQEGVQVLTISDVTKWEGFATQDYFITEIEMKVLIEYTR
jgi:hypothetical protein